MQRHPPSCYYAMRAETGRYCQLNCMQEALFPILKQRFSCDEKVFRILRFIALDEILQPLQDHMMPGDFGGVALPVLESLYHLRWNYPLMQRVGEDRLLIDAGAQYGPLIARIDRFFLPCSEHYYQVQHDPHIILLVGFDERSLYYSDYEYPHVPASLPWKAFWQALLPDYQQVYPFIATVQSCQDVTVTTKIDLHTQFVQHFMRSVGVAASSVLMTLQFLQDVLREAALGNRLHGYEVVYFLNGVIQSLQAMDMLFAMYEMQGHDLASLIGPLLGIQRFALLYMHSFQDNYYARMSHMCDRLVAIWSSATPAKLYQNSEQLLEKVMCQEASTGEE